MTYHDVDFGDGAKRIRIRLSAREAGIIEVFLGEVIENPSSPVQVAFHPTFEGRDFEEFTADLPPGWMGVQALTLRFRGNGGEQCSVDRMTFER